MSAADEPGAPEGHRSPRGPLSAAWGAVRGVWAWFKGRAFALAAWGQVTPANEVLLQGGAFRAAPRARRRWFTARLLWPTIGTLVLAPGLVAGGGGWIADTYAVAMVLWWVAYFNQTRTAVHLYRAAYWSGSAQAMADLIQHAPIEALEARDEPHPADPGTPRIEPAAVDRLR